MRKTIILYTLLISILLPSIGLVTYAHSGRTDGSGGHTNHSTGEYHYHHGYSAHDHYDMDGDGVKDCPYDFDDRTDHSSSKSSSDTTTRYKIISPTQETEFETQDDVKEQKSGFLRVLWFVVAVVIVVFLYIIA